MAVFPGGAVVVMIEFRRMPPFNRRLALLCLTGMIGGGAGAVLLFFTPERLFVAIVPALLGLATLIFAASPAIKRWIARRRAAGRGGRGSGLALLLGSVLIASVYGGYFGAGLGVILPAILAIAGFDELRVANLVKNLISTLISLVAVAVFVAKGLVIWPATLAMAGGAVFGGAIGVWLARVLPQGIVRAIVTVIGVALTLTYAWRFWLA
jgi:hypothetical protein